jgi:putative two-component system response regulator
MPDIILLDVHMPEVSGFEILKKLKADAKYREVPVVFLTGDEDVKTESLGLSEGAADFIRKPFASEVLLRRLRNIIELDNLRKDMEKEIRAKTEQLQLAYIQIVEALAASVDAKDRYTHGHSGRVALYAKEIARRAGYSETEQDRIFMMGLLHDVGKIGIQDAIINKNGRLTDAEYEEIKTHPAVGFNILKKITAMPDLVIGARSHHERYDGRGYPDGLSGESIPEIARIIGVADSYDAMTSKRSYRDPMPQEKVRAELAKGIGTQFDPQYAEIMIRRIDQDTEYNMADYS